MNLYKQYIGNNPVIELKVINAIESDFIIEFVDDYKLLLQEKNIIGLSFLEEEKTLKIVFEKFSLSENEDFDLLFISYLTLFKIEFENVNIQIHFLLDKDAKKDYLNSTIFKLIHHKVHLSINTKKEIFKIFVDGKENTITLIKQSKSYIPIVFIDRNSIDANFSKKDKSNNYGHLLIGVSTSLTKDKITNKDIFIQVQDEYLKKKGTNLKVWNSTDLSFLYLLKLLDELYVLRHLINKYKGIKSDYNIGRSIMHSTADSKSSSNFRDTMVKIIESYEIFKFSNMEIYFLSIIVQNSKLFKIPKSIDEMYSKIESFLNDGERKKCKTDDRALKKKYIEIYEFNLRKIINYTKEICYGLEELTKNIVEHSGIEKNEGFGIISGRTYSHNIIKQLKNVETNWLKNYNNNFKYLDINVIDTGTKDIIKSYQDTLSLEKDSCSKIDDLVLRDQMLKAYDNDIKEIETFDIKSFFNNASLKLFHQINRTKAKIGLLIFSQTILVEKKAFVSIGSSGLKGGSYSKGYFLYKENEIVKEKENSKHLNLGTNYNFIIPFNEKIEFERIQFKSEENKTSAASSVFLELFDYNYSEDLVANNNIKKFIPKNEYSGLGKYSKLENLKNEIGSADANELLLLDYKTLNTIVQNSSDWFRFLSDLQFSNEYIKDVIITNFDVDIYLELIQILKFYTNASQNNSGFWKDDRYILFFFPIKNESNTFWFNHLLYSTEYFKFLKINEEIGLYHQNLSRITQHHEKIKDIRIEYENIDSLLFSKSKKLLNFELLLKNDKDITIFEETLKSMLNVDINNLINENL